jgi:hypothetical protein
MRALLDFQVKLCACNAVYAGTMRASRVLRQASLPLADAQF